MIVYLPPDYNTSPEVRYPVLYMNDGQNLFDAATAFAGNEWGLDETAERMIAAREIQPLIIVGIYNTGYERLAEYTHVKDKRGRGGRARLGRSGPAVPGHRGHASGPGGRVRPRPSGR